MYCIAQHCISFLMPLNIFHSTHISNPVEETWKVAEQRKEEEEEVKEKKEEDRKKKVKRR